MRNALIKFFYNILLHLLVLLYFPKILYDLIIHKKYRKSLKYRLGFGFPAIVKGERPLIWIHAVSLGETKAVAFLAKNLKSHPSSPLILLTTHTETGFAEGERSLAFVDYHHYLPIDFNYIIRPIVKRVKPDLVLIVEGDLWLNFLDAAKESGSSVVMVNGKLSEKSFKRLKVVSSYTQYLLSLIDLYCLQSAIYKERFLTLGVSEDKLKVTGNLKLDAMKKQKSRDTLREEIGLEKDDLVLTLGSTHDPEEKILIRTIKSFWNLFPKLKVILVPRHSERCDAVARLLDENGISWSRYSKDPHFHNHQILLVDTMGQLLRFYALSDLAFVGGSFAERVGGHNIIEPTFYGVSVIFGPYMQGQPGMTELMLEANAGKQVTEETLQGTLLQFLEDEKLRDRMGKQGKKLIADAQGSLSQTEISLKSFLDHLL